MQDLSDPNSDRFIFWDDSESKINWLSAASLFDLIGLSPNDDNFIVGNGTNFITESGATARSSLGLGTMATQDNNSVNIDGSIISTSDITVGSGKTIDVSAGTLTLADDQISGDKVEGGTIASTTITSLTTAGITATGKIITPPGTTGDQTINAIAGSVNFASGATSLTVTNNLVDSNSVVILTRGTAVAANRNLSVAPTSGSFTITVDASFGTETKIFFLIVN